MHTVTVPAEAMKKAACYLMILDRVPAWLEGSEPIPDQLRYLSRYEIGQLYAEARVMLPRIIDQASADMAQQLKQS